MNGHLKINVYLNFNGNTETAFNFYKSVFGGNFSALQRFKDMPQTGQPIGANEAERIMHIALPIENSMVLMGSDISESMGHSLKPGNNMYISLHPDSKPEAERLYRELSANGIIEMPFEKMFWGAYYSAFADKFGIRWMVNFQES